MRYDAPRAVGIGDNSLNLAQAHLTLALVAQISRIWEHIPTSHWAQSQPLSTKLTERAKKAILTLQTIPAMEIKQI